MHTFCLLYSGEVMMQVHQLIMDATSIDNLCQMYIGWAPFL
jgi:phosphatidylinositol kinase/protein kinase (PI-3  family)